MTDPLPQEPETPMKDLAGAFMDHRYGNKEIEFVAERISRSVH